MATSAAVRQSRAERIGVVEGIVWTQHGFWSKYSHGLIRGRGVQRGLVGQQGTGNGGVVDPSATARWWDRA